MVTKTPQLTANDIAGVSSYLLTTVRTAIEVDRNKDAIDLDGRRGQPATSTGTATTRTTG